MLSTPPVESDTRESLAAELARYRELVAASNEGIYRLDFDPPVPVGLPLDEQIERILASGRVVAANPAMAAMYGFERPEELIGRPVAEMLVAADPVTRESLRRFVEGGYRYRDVESVEVDRDGRERSFLNSAVGVIEEGCLVSAWGSQRDLTEQKATLERLRQSEQRFAEAFRLNPGAIAISTFDEGRFVDVNHAFAETIGLPRERLIGRTGNELGLWASPEERARIVRAVAERGFARRVPASVRRADGEARQALISAMALELGGSRCLLILAEDVTEATRIAEALRRSEQRFRAATDGSRDAFFVLEALRDDAGRVVDFVFADSNREGERLLGRERTEVVGRRLGELVSNRRGRAYQDRCLRVMASGRVLEEELDVAEPGAPSRWIHHQIVPLPEGVAIWSRDVTERRAVEAERRRLERSLADAQRLESLGVLAGGVAHDFNNLLTGIQGYAELARRKAGSDSPLVPLLDEILLGARRAADLTQKMLAFAGGGSLEVEWVRLNEVVAEMAELASAGFTAGRRLELELAAPGPGLEGDATQLRQVALNLMLNAAEALDGDGGRVRVATGEATIDRARLGRCLLGQDLPEGRYAFLRVSDDGCGMSDEVKARIFDPFFSTKFAGRGLGLAAVLGIVKAHRGAIELDSAPGEGTDFAVLLPISSRRS